MRLKRPYLILVLVLGCIFLLAYMKDRVVSRDVSLELVKAQTGLSPAERSLPNFTELVKKVKPSVVNISTTTIVRGPDLREWFFGRRSPFDDFFGDYFERFFGDIPQREYKQRSLGSGFIIDKEGYILTNNHVVERAQTIKVKLYDSREYDAIVVGRDPKTDIALIKINPRQDLPVAVLGDSDKLEVGEWVIAIGNPFGLEHTVTAGIVSAKGRVIGQGPYDDFIQTDASINPGNSGGPLFNLRGEVVGINTAIISGGQGIGFAIPINLAKGIVEQLKTRKRVVRGWLGVSIQRVTPEIAKTFGLKEPGGALVAQVEEGSPADLAGIKRGDIIVEYDGKPVDMDTLPRLVASTEVGKKVKIKIIRDGKTIEKEVIIGEQKDEPQRASRQPEVEKNLGLVVQDLTPEIARHLNLKERTGVIVTDVQVGSPAYEADIRRGDIIKEVNRKQIKNTRDFKEAIRNVNLKEGVVMLLNRQNTTFYVVVKAD
ncbi:MAG: DegQ family serine endoprotease [Desulfobacterota bacterium]|nr:DegQ family serine endoprotease [Thermodesulfobacteriota bacterium]MDW8002412.1 DegQ family serine endoprotease [Deltaproteobacteria bacterium]